MTTLRQAIPLNYDGNDISLPRCYTRGDYQRAVQQSNITLQKAKNIHLFSAAADLGPNTRTTDITMRNLYGLVDISDDGGTAYVYRNFTDMQKGRITEMRIGKYLRLRYVAWPDEEIAETVNRVKTAARLITDPIDAGIVHFAYEPEAIVNVYKHGPRSCMQGKDSVRVYGAGDIACAYTSIDGCITARTLVNIKEKLYCKVYGNTTLMHAALEHMGYTNDSLALEGCRILRIAEDNSFVMPYIDSVGYVTEDVEGDCFIITEDGDHSAQHEGGLLDHGEICADCGERHDEEESTYVSEHGMICPGCMDEYRWIESQEEYAHIDDCVYLDYKDEYELLMNVTETDHSGWCHDDDVEEVCIDGDDITYNRETHRPELVVI